MSLIVSDLLARGQGLGGGHLRGKCRRSREKGETCDSRSVPVCETCRRSLEKDETCDSRTVLSGKRRRRSAVDSWQIIRLAQRSVPSGRFSGKASGILAEMPVFPAALRSAARSVADFSARRQDFGPKCPRRLAKPPCTANPRRPADPPCLAKPSYPAASGHLTARTVLERAGNVDNRKRRKLFVQQDNGFPARNQANNGYIYKISQHMDRAYQSPESESIAFVLDKSLLQMSDLTSGNVSGLDMDDPIFQNPF